MARGDGGDRELGLVAKMGITMLIILALSLAASMVAGVVMLFGSDTIGSGNVAIIPIEGVIVAGTGGAGAGYVTSDELLDDIQTAEDDDAIEAVVFLINSPGGSAVASEEVAARVLRMEKPNVAVVREVGASGAYWIASATDRVFASRMSVTGSIGVLGSYVSFGRFLDHWNVTYNQLTGGAMKDIGTPLRELMPQEREFLQAKIDTMHAYFIEDVAANRNLSVAQVTPFADGRFLLGQEAIDAWLVDEIGNEDDALAYLEETLDFTAEPVLYERERSIWDLLGSVRGAQDGLDARVPMGVVQGQVPQAR